MDLAPNQPGTPKVYRGRPENQKDPRAVNRFKNKPPKGEAPKNNPPPPPPKLQPGSHVQQNQNAEHKITTGNPAEGSVFTSNIAVRETRQRQTFTPSAPALIEITRQSYAEMLTDDPQLNKALLPEFLDYYSTALLWLRIINLKQRNSQALTEAEQDILMLTQTTNFCVPEPILLQLKQLGNICTMGKQHLYPEFPPLPVVEVNHQPGYYGALEIGNAADPHVHNLYEEIPCLGVLAEAVRNSISDAQPGRYASSLDIDAQNRVNNNLLGFRPLGIRRGEAKNLAFSVGVTPDEFPCNPDNTAFNYELICAISSVVSTTKTFKNTDIVFSTLAEVGAQSQAIISRPLVQAGRLNILGETRTTSLNQETSSCYGSAVFFGSQLMKTPGPNNNHNTWLCINLANIPAQWVNNRNERRNLPIQYQQEVFQAISLDASTYRISIIKQLVIAKR